MAKLTLKSIIFKKYLVIKKIDEGSFGSIYLSQNIQTKEKVAIKIENRKTENPLLEREAYILFYLRGPGLPEIKTFGKTKDLFILIQNLLGPSLANLLDKHSIVFTIKDICMLSIQMIERLEYIHLKNYIHRDIKPHNFLMGIDDPDILYLIDFGLSKKYRSKKGKHIKFSINNNITGTPRYCSINGLRGAEQSRRDDLESLFYVIIYFFRGNLPWQNLKIKSRQERFNRINYLKKNISYKILCKNLPQELYNFGTYIKRLKFEEDPDYNFLRNCFDSILKKINEKNDNKFSWLTNFKSYSNNKKQKDNQPNIVRRKNSSHKRLLEKISSSLEKKMKRKYDNNLNKVEINLINTNKDNITLKSFYIENNAKNIKKTNSYVVKQINHITSLNKNKNKDTNDFLKHINRNQINNLNIKKNKTQFYSHNTSNILYSDESNINEKNYNSNNNELLKNIFANNSQIFYNSPNYIINLKKENSMKNLKLNFKSEENYIKLFERNKNIKQNFIPNNTEKSFKKIINLKNIINDSPKIKNINKRNFNIINIGKKNSYLNNKNNNHFRSYTNMFNNIKEIKNNEIKRINTDTSLKLNKNNTYNRLNLNIKYIPKLRKINNQNINLNIKLINNNNYNNILLKNSINNKNNLIRFTKYKTHRKAITNSNNLDLNINKANDITNNIIVKKVNNKVKIINLPINKKQFNNKFLLYHSNIIKK